MVRRAFVQRSLVEVWLPDGDKLWDPALRAIDAVLTDDGLVDQVVEALGRRHRQSRRRGRLGTAGEGRSADAGPEAPVRLVLRRVRARGPRQSVYRPFCRIDGERVPDAKTLIRLSHCLGPDVLKGLVERLVALARQRRVVRGRRLRVDTTVVETNTHYPTDSALLADGVRVADPNADAAAHRGDGRRGAAPRSDAERGPPGLRDRAEAPSRPPTMPISRPRGHGALGGTRGHREQPVGPGTSGAWDTLRATGGWSMGREDRERQNGRMRQVLGPRSARNRLDGQQGGSSESRRQGRARARTRRMNPSALPLATRQPCCRSRARITLMYPVRVRTSASRTVKRPRTCRWASESRWVGR
jgi:hypothetical protein